MRKLSCFKFLFFAGFLVFYSGFLIAAPPDNISLTIEGGDPFATSGITAQSNGDGVDESTSQLGSVLGLSQNYFQTGDINLTQGAMQQSDVDLNLPGKNGLNLTISRTYSSLKFNSFPDIYPFKNETRISNRGGNIFLYVTTAIWKGIRSRFHFGISILHLDPASL